jgi:cytochrome oxidase Cu insertion factor (SCO1/SenC/PrrC family)
VRGSRGYLAITAGMAAFLVALIAVLFVACGSPATSSTGGATATTAEANAGFSGVTLDGTEVSLSEYRGKPLVLAFMASW